MKNKINNPEINNIVNEGAIKYFESIYIFVDENNLKII
jgi:hypothetical protein